MLSWQSYKNETLGGEKAKIKGPFADFMGTVDEIDLDRARMRVLISFFGQEKPVELDFSQVERV
jgi:transcriptional antiterminator NusG